MPASVGQWSERLPWGAVALTLIGVLTPPLLTRPVPSQLHLTFRAFRKPLRTFNRTVPQTTKPHSLYGTHVRRVSQSQNLGSVC